MLQPCQQAKSQRAGLNLYIHFCAEGAEKTSARPCVICCICCTDAGRAGLLHFGSLGQQGCDGVLQGSLCRGDKSNL